jgi:NosR/NirI family transcriptional regulator, nitrous oxide reductase regulator
MTGFPPYRPILVAATLLCALAGGVQAIDKEDPLERRLSARALDQAFPEADEVGTLVGEPAVAEVLIDDALAGYVFSTYDTDPIGGFTGLPFDLLVGLDLEGRLRGVHVVEHHEPIISHSAIPPSRLDGFFRQLAGFPVDQSLRNVREAADAISGATVSSELMRSAVLSSARKIATQYGMIDGLAGGASVDMGSYEARDWQALLDRGAVTRLSLPGDGGELLEVYATLATPPGIGRNYFGDSWHTFHISELGTDDHLLVFAGTGNPALFGKTPGGGTPYANVRVVQDGKVLPLSRDNKLGKPSIIADGAPFFSERVMFRLGLRDGFDALKPWSLEFDLGETSHNLAYSLPAAYVTGSDLALEEAGFKEPTYVLFGLLRESLLNGWQRVWVARAGDIVALVGLLAALSLMLLWQDRLVRNRRLYRSLRLGFLTVVLVWLGWIADAQLTTLNIVTYARTMISGLDPALVLLDPLIFLLSAYVLVTLLLWGRGVFCGWLCPFGALQEIVGVIARALRLPRIDVPESLGERLAAVKYLTALAIFGLAIWSSDAAQVAAEVEPFKTAIVVGFARHWPYVLYAGVLIALSLFVERFFCRFLCPLGGALSVLGRWHVMRWLRQRPQCGNPCAVCQRVCPVGAIRGDGGIDMNECFQCLDCQVEYFDQASCPPLIQQRKQAERAAAA